MSLRARMALFAGAAVAIAVIAVVVAGYGGTRNELQHQVDQSLQSLSKRPLQNIGLGPGGGPPGGQFQFGPHVPSGNADHDPDEGLGFDHLPPQAFGGASGTFTLFKPGGGTYVPKGQSYEIPSTPAIRALAAAGHGQIYTDMRVDGTHIRVLVTGIGDKGALAVALPLTSVDSALSNQLVLLIVIGGAGILLAVLFGLLVARTALAPITRFTRQTESIAENPERIEHERLDVSGSDELARLARTFNQTLDALELSVQSQRNLVADASHELRTPIATIRANLQLMREEELLSPEDRAGLREDVIEELDELTALVADVVELARGSKPTSEPGDVRLDSIVHDALERARRRAPTLDFHQVVEPTLIRGEPDRISRAVTNLLDNASKWSPRGRHGRGDAARRRGDRPRPRPWVQRRGPAVRVRPLPPRHGRALEAGLGPRARDRPPGGRGARRLRRGGERARRRRDPPRRVRGAARARRAPGGGADRQRDVGARSAGRGRSGGLGHRRCQSW